MNCFRLEWDFSFGPILHWSFDKETRKLQNFVVRAVIRVLEQQGFVPKTYGIEFQMAVMWICCIGDPAVGNLEQLQFDLKNMFGLEGPLRWTREQLPSEIEMYGHNFENDWQQEEMSAVVKIVRFEPKESNFKRSLLSYPENASKIVESLKTAIHLSQFEILDIDVQYSFFPTFVNVLTKGQKSRQEMLLQSCFQWLTQNENNEIKQGKLVISERLPNKTLLQNLIESHYTQTVTLVDNLSCLLNVKLDPWFELRKFFRLFCFERQKNGFEKLSFRSMTELLFNLHSPKVEAVGLLPVFPNGSKLYGLLQKRNPNMAPSLSSDDTDNDYWNMIAGHVENTDSTLINTLFRETREELGEFNPFGCSVDHVYILSFERKSNSRFVLFVTVLDPKNAMEEWSSLLHQTIPNDEVDLTYQPYLYEKENLFQPPNGYDWFDLENLPQNFKFGPRQDPTLVSRSITQTLPFIKACSPEIYHCFRS